MQKQGSIKRNVNLLHIFSRHPGRHSENKSPSVRSAQQSFPAVVQEKGVGTKAGSVLQEDSNKVKVLEHRIDIGDEKSDLLGYVVISGKLILDDRNRKADADIQTTKENIEQNGFEAKLTSKAFAWGSHALYLDDIVSVTYNSGVRYFTIHAYPSHKKSCCSPFLFKPKRSKKDFRFLTTSSEEAVKWVSGFAEMNCYINCLRHPLSSKREGLEISDFFLEPYIKRKIPPTVLVILNPRSGHGRSSKVYYNKVEPIFKLAGFNLQVVETTKPGHAKELASTINFNTCPDGIICVGGDGIVNEVLNGLLSRNDQKEAISIPIGIIPAGSDNSLVFTVLGIKNPVSAAIAIVKGGLTPTDVFAVEWTRTGERHFGITVSYYGFVSDVGSVSSNTMKVWFGGETLIVDADVTVQSKVTFTHYFATKYSIDGIVDFPVLELSERYQKRFGPLRYLVAGALKFMCLPKYSFELEYLPAEKVVTNSDSIQERRDSSILYQDIVIKSPGGGLQRASSLSSIDSILTPSRNSGDLDTTSSAAACSEPSDIVRGIGSKSKRISFGKSNTAHEPVEVLCPPVQLSQTSFRLRTRSKLRTDHSLAVTTNTNEARGYGSNTMANDKEDISSTLSDPGPIWDAEPPWDMESGLDAEVNSFPDGGPLQQLVMGGDIERRMELEASKQEEKWVSRSGEFLGVLLCNHACRTVQNSNQVVAPFAEYDDQALDLVLVHGNGRFRLLRFFLLMQFGKHLSLPYVEYVQVKSLRVKAGKDTHNGCGIDGELCSLNGQVIASLLPDQCRLIGRSPQIHV